MNQEAKYESASERKMDPAMELNIFDLAADCKGTTVIA
jgi:hypothetical protein